MATPADSPSSAGTAPIDVTPPLAAVLVACTRDPGDARTAAALRAAVARVASAPPGEPGWDALADAALRHGMSGLLYRRVVDLAYETVPQAVLLGWREHAVATAQRSLRLQRQLLHVLDALDATGVAALAFKGPALSQQLYGDAGVRHFIDLDVLVQPHQLTTAREVLLESGYRDTLPLDGLPLALLQEAEHHMAFTHAETGASVEVHWRVGPRFAADSLPADALFARQTLVELLSRKVATLGPLDLVVILTVHEAKHGWDKLEGVTAVASALRRLSAEEARDLPSLALEYGGLRRLHIGVLLAATLAQEAIPPDLAHAAAGDKRAKDIASWVGSRLLWSVAAPEALREQDRRARAQGVLWQAVGLDTRSAAFRHLWRRAFSTGVLDWDETQAPERPKRAGRVSGLWRRQGRFWRPPGAGGH